MCACAVLVCPVVLGGVGARVAAHCWRECMQGLLTTRASPARATNTVLALADECTRRSTALAYLGHTLWSCLSISCICGRVVCTHTHVCCLCQPGDVAWLHCTAILLGGSGAELLCPSAARAAANSPVHRVAAANGSRDRTLGTFFWESSCHGRLWRAPFCGFCGFRHVGQLAAVCCADVVFSVVGLAGVLGAGATQDHGGCSPMHPSQQHTGRQHDSRVPC